VSRPRLAVRPTLAMVALSVLDGALTQLEVTQGWASEANPALAWALSIGGWSAFWALKLSLLGAGCLALVVTGRRSRAANAAVGGLLVLHLGVLTLHAFGICSALTQP